MAQHSPKLGFCPGTQSMSNYYLKRDNGRRNSCLYLEQGHFSLLSRCTYDGSVICCGWLRPNSARTYPGSAMLTTTYLPLHILPDQIKPQAHPRLLHQAMMLPRHAEPHPHSRKLGRPGHGPRRQSSAAAGESRDKHLSPEGQYPEGRRGRLLRQSRGLDGPR